MDDIIPQRQCTKCPRILPLTPDNFQRDKYAPDGFRRHCKECEKRSRNKPEVKAKALAYGRAYYHAHKEEKAELHKDWYAKNREYSLEKDRQFRIDHPEILAQRWQNWYQTENGKEHSRIRVRNRRNRRKGAQGNYTYADIQKQLTNQKSKCYYCSVKLGKDYHIDHVVPVSRGGSNDPSNLVISCKKCNLSKKDKLPHEWSRGGRLM